MKNDNGQGTNFGVEKIFPGDARVTAYAFGELEGEELARVEAAVNADPALLAAVAELRGFGKELTGAFAAEPWVDASNEASDQEDGRVEPDEFAGVGASTGGGFGAWLAKLSGFYYVAGGMAAAGFAVMFAVRSGEDKGADFGDAEAPVVMEMVASEPAPERKLSAKEAHDSQAPVDRQSSLVVGFDSSRVQPAALPKLDTDAFSKDLSGRIDKQAAAAAPEPSLAVGQVLALPPPPVAPASIERSGFAASAIQGQPVALETRLRRGVVSAGVAGGRAFALDDVKFESFEAEGYAHPGDNGFRAVAEEPLSTFSIDVDTASYSNVRRFLTQGVLPPRDAVRVEELINYFPYRYVPPRDDVPFAAHMEVASAPWNPAHRLVRVGIKGRELTAATRAQANIVFLLDVSGSMSSANKLPLVKESMRLLVERLRPDDRVAIVTYAGNSGLALPSTPAAKKREILGALESLAPGGSTNGAMGIHLAYDIAKANFVSGGVNRVILCTDGDFNVGVTSRDELVRLIEEKAKSRVFLSVFGFGMGNLKDHTLESLANKGNGTYGYIDSRREAEKVFVEQLEGTLATIAKDVKIQVEFNPAQVDSYRLIGYENRLLKKEDFNNDTIDAGEIGAGHTVTALYEVVPVGVVTGAAGEGGEPRPVVDPLKYQPAAGTTAKPVTTDSKRRTAPVSRELLTVKIRYKAPEGDLSKKQEFPLVDRGAEFGKASADFRFASAVAAWGMLLRESPHRGSATLDGVLVWAEEAMGDDTGGHRAEFVQLVRRSAELRGR